MKTTKERKVFLFLSILFAGLFVFFSWDAFGQETPGKKSGDDSSTTVQVPVRVMLDNKPVIDLTKEDFTVFENKKKVEIDSVILRTRPLIVKDDPTVSGSLEPRTFVVVFDILYYNSYLEKAVDKLFEKIIRSDDRLLVIINKKKYDYPDLSNEGHVRDDIMNNLIAEGKQAADDYFKFYNQMANFLQGSRYNKRLEGFVDFLEGYLIKWQEYKNTYILPSSELLYVIAQYLENIKTEKWVLHFHQFDIVENTRINEDMLGDLRIYARDVYNEVNEMSSGGSRLDILLDRATKSLNLETEYSTEAVSRLFYKVDAPLVNVLIKDFKLANRESTEYQDVFSQLENIYKKIAQIHEVFDTTSTDIASFMDALAYREDMSYLISYTSSEPASTAKIKIETRIPKCKPIYDSDYRKNYISDHFNELARQFYKQLIAVSNFSFKDKVLAFTVKDYATQLIGETETGQMKIRIRLTDGDGKSLFDQEKVMTSQKKEIKIALNIFKTLKSGKYVFSIDATDMLSKRATSLREEVKVKD